MTRFAKPSDTLSINQKRVISIRSAVRQRQNLLTYIRDNLSNDALCKQYGVSEHVISRTVAYQSYGHIA